MILFRRSILFSMLGFFLPALHRWPKHQDSASVTQDLKVLFENEHVRVQFHHVEVGETTVMHSHPAYVAYVFNTYTGKSILNGGMEIPLTRKAGEVFYNGPNRHKIVNTGDTPIHNLIVELKKVRK
jgi:hypothetical protein